MKIFENGVGYIVLLLLIVAQCTIRVNYLAGQFMYLGANLLSVTRCFILKRQKADKVKDVCCTAITVGLIIMFMFMK